MMLTQATGVAAQAVSSAISQASTAQSVAAQADISQVVPKGMVQTVKAEELQPGDHIYVWRMATLFAHHGVVVGINPVTVAHHDSHSIRLDCFHNFLKEKEASIHKVKYQGTWAEATFKRSGTCSMAKPDPVDLIILRALSLVGNDRVNYHFLDKNCELFVKYCVLGPHRCGLEDFRSSEGAASDQSSYAGIAGTAATIAIGAGMCLAAGELALGAAVFTLASTQKLCKRRDSEIRDEDNNRSELHDLTEKLLRRYNFEYAPQIFTQNGAEWNESTAATFCEMIMDTFDRSEGTVVTPEVGPDNLTEAEVMKGLEKIIQMTLTTCQLRSRLSLQTGRSCGNLKGDQGDEKNEMDASSEEDHHDPEAESSNQRQSPLMLLLKRPRKKKAGKKASKQAASVIHGDDDLKVGAKADKKARSKLEEPSSTFQVPDSGLRRRSSSQPDSNLTDTTTSSSHLIKPERNGGCFNFKLNKKQKTNFEPSPEDNRF